MLDTKKARPAAAGKRANKDEGALRDTIARKAYEIYEERGREHGKDFEHWLEAEAIIMAEMRKLNNS
ncbi:MAG: hypothetical protein A3J42_07840 [Candidatus Dadabacteria bacterium RIFCSPHIGHO2_12_FULL_53_21]|nr:MAG: hypothetical protein A3J42_07840 [Candidatus Dadabacteria bacterium RIFCSPHIGHO2_12_FULL_53_21]